jgi:DNA-directed RNA polymerase sigma subunit (sigma70/sigma32)
MWSDDPRMPVSDVEELLRLVRDIDRAGSSGDVGQVVAALNVVQRLERHLSSTRDEAIRALHRSGETLQRIGERSGLSRARVHQIVRSVRR